MMECPAKLKPHLGHSLELDHKCEDGQVSIKVHCCECGEDVGILYEGPDVSKRVWEVHLKLDDVCLRDLPIGAKPGSTIDIYFKDGTSLSTATILSIEEHRGKHFICAGCGKIKSCTVGHDDDMPFHCDACWAKEHPSEVRK